MLYLVLSLFLAKGFRWIKYQLHHQSLSSLTWGQSPHLLPPRWLVPQMSKPSWPGALSGRVLLVVKGYKDCLWYVKKKLHTWRIVYLGFRIYKWYIYIYIYCIHIHDYKCTYIPKLYDTLAGRDFLALRWFSYALLKNHPFSSMIFPFLHFHWIATPDFHIFSNDIPIQTARVVNSHIIFQQFFRLTFPWKLHFRPAASCASPETRWASAGCCDPHGTAKQRGRTIMGWSYGENSAKIATLEMFKP